MEQKISLTSHAEAHRHASGRFRSAMDNGAILAPEGSVIDVTSDFHAYVFQLQEEIEGEGFMDYRKYARRMWGKFIGDVPEDEATQPLGLFESSLIANLHAIDMTKHVYPEVFENLGELVEKRGDQVKEVVLWSTGDVGATGYQNGKIDSSRIVQQFHSAIKAHPEEASHFLRKTSYMVDDEKHERMAARVEELVDAGEYPKIVIIEDNKKNFDRAWNAISGRLGELSTRVAVEAIWALYSREGAKAYDAAVKGGDEAMDLYNQQVKELHGIKSFAELTDPKFDRMFNNAYVFVDFDGVIGNNVTMKVDQSRAIYFALLQGAKAAGIGEDELKKRIELALPIAA